MRTGKTRSGADAIVGDVARTPLDPRQHAPSVRIAMERFADAIFDLSDEPTSANIARYLAASRALEESRRTAARAYRRKAA